MDLLPVIHGPVSVCAGKLNAFFLHLLGEQRLLGGPAAGHVQLVLVSVLDRPDGRSQLFAWESEKKIIKTKTEQIRKKAHLKLGEILRLGDQTLDGPETHAHLVGDLGLGFARFEHPQCKRFFS